MPPSPRTIRIEDLIRSKIVMPDGTVLGRVVDVEVTPGPEYRVTGVVFGAVSWLYRFHVLAPVVQHFGRRWQPKRLPWADVEDWEPYTLHAREGATLVPVEPPP